MHVLIDMQLCACSLCYSCAGWVWYPSSDPVSDYAVNVSVTIQSLDFP